MRLVVSQLTGGLGNQLFQYAVGYAAAKRADADFALDVRHYDVVDPTLPARPFALQRFAVSAPVMDADQQRRVDDAVRLDRRLRRLLLTRLVPQRMPVLVDRAEGDDERLHRLRSSAYLVGCWQTEKLFATYRDALLRDLVFREPPSARGADTIRAMQAGTSVSVHFRRTDYLRPETLTGPLSLDYYRRALAAMAERFPDAHYFIFSDDPAWVQANAPLPPRHTMVTHEVGTDDSEDMRLMAHCDHFVIANSSFSWWGAWLSQSPGKRVIAPNGWYKAHHGSERELVPDGWTRM